MNHWIFQGSPKRYDIDDYLARYPLVYWSCPTMAKEMVLGDSVHLWRADPSPGVVAEGVIAELPVERSKVLHPEALGGDLWFDPGDEPSTIRVGIFLNDVRLTPAEGMLTKNSLKKHPILSKSTIVLAPRRTVFRLKPQESQALNTLWSQPHDAFPESIEKGEPSSIEGRRKEQMHTRRERCRRIIEDKKVQYLTAHPELACEVCGFSFLSRYPDHLGRGFIEVHHLTPISSLDGIRKTELKDLHLVCSNCHRMIHRTHDIEQNLTDLKAHFRRS